jgi:hypothetical protein
MREIRTSGLTSGDGKRDGQSGQHPRPSSTLLTIMVTSGLLPASARADYYYPNTYFRIKLILLALIGVHAAVFRRRVYGKRSVPVPRTGRLAACLSLALWIGILSMGRWIAYFERARPAVTEIGR